MRARLNLLLDSHILLWCLADSPKLPAAARRAVARAGLVYVSVATVWELGLKAANGKLVFPRDIEDELRANQFEPLPVSIAHALAAARLPFHHRDPFDRMLVAQARLESLTLVTVDARLKTYGVPVLPA